MLYPGEKNQLSEQLLYLLHSLLESSTLRQTATLKSLMSAHTIRVQLCIVAASDVPSNTRLFASIRVPAQKNRLDTAVSRTAQWNETFPFLLLTLSAPVELEITERCRLRKSKLLGTTKTTVEEMLKMAGNNQGFVVLAMKPFKPVVVSPQLTLSIRIHELDVGSVSAQLGNIYLSDIGSPNSDELFQRVLYRLECLTRFTSGIAQLNPIANAVYFLTKGIAQSDSEFAQTIKDHVATNKNLTKLIHRIHTVLEFVELTQHITAIGKFPDLVNNILSCIERCILFLSSREQASPALEELNELHIRMTQALTLGVAWNLKTQKDKQLFKLLNPLSMEMVPPSTRDVCFPGTRTKVVSEITQWGLSSPDKILWMHAHPGSGKTTIAMTMANIFEGMGRLAVLCFSTKMLKSGQNHLAWYEPLPISSAAIERILRMAFTDVKNDERVVIIIDALDEGGQGYYQEAFLKLLSRLPSTSRFVRILITSRKYPQIQQAFSKVPDLRVLDLMRFQTSTMTFIDSSLRRWMISGENTPHLPTTWPGMEAVDSLVKHACGLFIWATVACAYIKADEPAEHIKTLLSNPSERQLQEESLDNLYTIAIHAAGNWDQAKFAKDMHSVLSIIIFSQNPQSLECIGELLEMTHIRTSEMISRLQSIIRTDQNGMVHAIHPSVHDYLVDPRSVKPTAELAHTIYTFFSKHLMHWLEALGIMVQGKDYLYCAALAPDDHTIICGFCDGCVQVWDIESQLPLSPLLVAHQNAVAAFAFSTVNHWSSQAQMTAQFRCGLGLKYFASGSRDTTIIVWNTSDGSAVFSPLKGHKAEIVALEISPDDKILVSASTDGSIYFWDLGTGQMNGAPLTHSEEVISIKLSPDGLRLASITNSTLTVWGVSNRDYLLGPLAYPGHEYRAIAFSNNGHIWPYYVVTFRSGRWTMFLALKNHQRGNEGEYCPDEANDIQGGNIYWPTMQYAIEDKYFILRYAVDQAIVSRAFDAATGQDYKDGSESPHIPEFYRLAAMGSQILGTDGLILQLPEDFGHMGTIMCWESTKDMIVIGTAAESHRGGDGSAPSRVVLLPVSNVQIIDHITVGMMAGIVYHLIDSFNLYPRPSHKSFIPSEGT
ncbi:hypothetical protein B0H14DRAFT_3126845 [Mycena olivaceomarginata]|nr:hypothetical protein B0H14DRAFT_3126845 [Mycena olivaceomarginata]